MFNFITQRLQTKLILAFVLVLLIPTTIIGTYAVVSETNKLIDVYRTDELGLVQGQAKAVALTVSRAKNALLQIAQSPDTQRYADSLTVGTGDATFKHEFQEPLMLAFLSNSDKGVYKDIRILDKTGQEIVRVDDSAGTPTVIADNELENKADRPYFLEAVKLPAGQVYASGLDLNTTKGKIDVPYLPVIRFSTPLRTKDGAFVGVMVIKAYAKAILADIAADDASENALLVDSQGTYWLDSDASKLYGPLANTKANIQTDLPNDSANLATQEDQVLVGSKDRPDLAQAIVHVKLPGEVTSRWTVIHQQPIANVLNEVNQVRNTTLLFAGLSIIIALVLALYITRGIVRPVVQLSDSAKQISKGNLDAPVPASKSHDEIGQLTASFGTMTRDLKTSYDSLARRAKEMETVATVSANAASTLDADKLLLAVSNLTKENFALYHAHIYLLDDAGEKLALTAGAGEAGRIMKAQGRTIDLNNLGSLVARAARNREGVIVNDVTQVPDFLPNPLLPDTKSEMAVPMIVGKRLVGVLDVQSEQVNRFTETDINVMTTLAAQVAVAVQNAGAYQEAEHSRRQAEVIAEANATLSRSETEIDLLRTLFNIAPKEGLSYATLSHINTDQQNNLETMDIVAGLMPDGNPLDLRVFPSTSLKPEDFPLVGMVFANPDVPLVVSDIMTDPTADESVRAFASAVQAIAFILLPLKTGDEWHGMMSISYSTPQNFSPELIETLQKVMPTAGSVMAARKAYQQAQAGRRQAETIADANATLSRSETEIGLLQTLFDIAPKEGLSYATLSYITNDSQNNFETMDIVAGLLPDGNPLDLSVFPSTSLKPEDFPLIGMTYANPDVPLVVNDIMSDPTADESVRAFASAVQAIAFILIPLKTGDDWHGMMSVTYATPQNFSPELIEILQRIMPTAGSVMAARKAFAQETVARRETELRATELQTVAKVSATAATSLNTDDLLQNVSELVKSNFGLYHAHVYLLDPIGDTLVLAAGAGEAGRIMKEKGRSIGVSNEGSLVARAARLREGVIVNDVTLADDFLPNPLLPYTKSEMAVPMVVADRLVGVLDVQSDVVGRFSESDIHVLTTLSDQIAVAVQNAQLYEQQLETSEQLRAVDRLKSEFLASMSHELRTPLNSIIGYSRMMLDNSEDGFTEDTVEDLSAIHNGGKHLLSLINDILDLAKIEANKLELDSEPVEFATVANEVSQMTSVLFKDKPVALVVDVPENMPQLWADRIRLRQILNNLVSNAVKFTEEGEVRIKAGYDSQSNEAIISVIDTGIGIPPEKLALIFERFTQVDSSSARRAGGTGLGLTITKHLIDMHGGRIWVESEADKGSTFAFSIPLVGEHEVAGD